MSSNCIFFGWNRSIPGRERLSAEHFQEFAQYLSSQQQRGNVKSFDVVFLHPHGGDMNGFFLIRGENAKLDALVASDEWVTHQTRAMLHLESGGAVRGVTGDLIPQRMDLWSKHIPG
ncbi:MAG TPA: hypothetical protein VFR86_14520 [Burkholderiaceae bacterium]|nr:hypothetical protein [Burkholderiaceae bacterium]